MSMTDIPGRIGSSTSSEGSGPEAKVSRLAVASLVLGILGILILPAIGAIACGLAALFRIHGSQGTLKGKGMALAGIILSAVMLALVPVVAISAGLLLPALAKAKARAQNVSSLSNVRQLVSG